MASQQIEDTEKPLSQLMDDSTPDSDENTSKHVLGVKTSSRFLFMGRASLRGNKNPGPKEIEEERDTRTLKSLTNELLHDEEKEELRESSPVNVENQGGENYHFRSHSKLSDSSETDNNEYTTYHSEPVENDTTDRSSILSNESLENANTEEHPKKREISMDFSNYTSARLRPRLSSLKDLENNNSSENTEEKVVENSTPLEESYVEDEPAEVENEEEVFYPKNETTQSDEVTIAEEAKHVEEPYAANESVEEEEDFEKALDNVSDEEIYISKNDSTKMEESTKEHEELLEELSQTEELIPRNESVESEREGGAVEEVTEEVAEEEAAEEETTEVAKEEAVEEEVVVQKEDELAAEEEPSETEREAIAEEVVEEENEVVVEEELSETEKEAIAEEVVEEENEVVVEEEPSETEKEAIAEEEDGSSDEFFESKEETEEQLEEPSEFEEFNPKGAAAELEEEKEDSSEEPSELRDWNSHEEIIYSESRNEVSDASLNMRSTYEVIPDSESDTVMLSDIAREEETVSNKPVITGPFIKELSSGSDEEVKEKDDELEAHRGIIEEANDQRSYSGDSSSAEDDVEEAIAEAEEESDRFSKPIIQELDSSSDDSDLDDDDCFQPLEGVKMMSKVGSSSYLDVAQGILPSIVESYEEDLLQDENSESWEIGRMRKLEENYNILEEDTDDSSEDSDQPETEEQYMDQKKTPVEEAEEQEEEEKQSEKQSEEEINRESEEEENVETNKEKTQEVFPSRTEEAEELSDSDNSALNFNRTSLDEEQLVEDFGLQREEEIEKATEEKEEEVMEEPNESKEEEVAEETEITKPNAEEKFTSISTFVNPLFLNSKEYVETARRLADVTKEAEEAEEVVSTQLEEEHPMIPSLEDIQDDNKDDEDDDAEFEDAFEDENIEEVVYKKEYATDEESIKESTEQELIEETSEPEFIEKTTESELMEETTEQEVVKETTEQESLEGVEQVSVNDEIADEEEIVQESTTTELRASPSSETIEVMVQEEIEEGEEKQDSDEERRKSPEEALKEFDEAISHVMQIENAEERLQELEKEEMKLQLEEITHSEQIDRVNKELAEIVKMEEKARAKEMERRTRTHMIAVETEEAIKEDEELENLEEERLKYKLREEILRQNLQKKYLLKARAHSALLKAQEERALLLTLLEERAMLNAKITSGTIMEALLEKVISSHTKALEEKSDSLLYDTDLLDECPLEQELLLESLKTSVRPSMRSYSLDREPKYRDTVKRTVLATEGTRSLRHFPSELREPSMSYVSSYRSTSSTGAIPKDPRRLRVNKAKYRQCVAEIERESSVDRKKQQEIEREAERIVKTEEEKERYERLAKEEAKENRTKKEILKTNKERKAIADVERGIFTDEEARKIQACKLARVARAVQMVRGANAELEQYSRDSTGTYRSLPDYARIERLLERDRYSKSKVLRFKMTFTQEDIQGFNESQRQIIKNIIMAKDQHPMVIVNDEYSYQIHFPAAPKSLNESSTTFTTEALQDLQTQDLIRRFIRAENNEDPTLFIDPIEVSINFPKEELMKIPYFHHRAILSFFHSFPKNVAFAIVDTQTLEISKPFPMEGIDTYSHIDMSVLSDSTHSLDYYRTAEWGDSRSTTPELRKSPATSASTSAASTLERDERLYWYPHSERKYHTYSHYPTSRVKYVSTREPKYYAHWHIPKSSKELQREALTTTSYGYYQRAYPIGTSASIDRSRPIYRTEYHIQTVDPNERTRTSTTGSMDRYESQWRQRLYSDDTYAGRHSLDSRIGNKESLDAAQQKMSKLITATEEAVGSTNVVRNFANPFREKELMEIRRSVHHLTSKYSTKKDSEWKKLQEQWHRDRERMREEQILKREEREKMFERQQRNQDRRNREEIEKLDTLKRDYYIRLMKTMSLKERYLFGTDELFKLRLEKEEEEKKLKEKEAAEEEARKKREKEEEEERKRKEEEEERIRQAEEQRKKILLEFGADIAALAEPSSELSDSGKIKDLDLKPEKELLQESVKLEEPPKVEEDEEKEVMVETIIQRPESELEPSEKEPEIEEEPTVSTEEKKERTIAFSEEFVVSPPDVKKKDKKQKKIKITREIFESFSPEEQEKFLNSLTPKERKKFDALKEGKSMKVLYPKPVPEPATPKKKKQDKIKITRDLFDTFTLKEKELFLSSLTPKERKKFDSLKKGQTMKVVYPKSAEELAAPKKKKISLIPQCIRPQHEKPDAEENEDEITLFLTKESFETMDAKERQNLISMMSDKQRQAIEDLNPDDTLEITISKHYVNKSLGKFIVDTHPPRTPIKGGVEVIEFEEIIEGEPKGPMSKRASRKREKQMREELRERRRQERLSRKKSQKSKSVEEEQATAEGTTLVSTAVPIDVPESDKVPEERETKERAEEKIPQVEVEQEVLEKPEGEKIAPVEEASVKPEKEEEEEEKVPEPTEEIAVKPEEVTITPVEEITVKPEEGIITSVEEITVKPEEEVTITSVEEITVKPEETTIEPVDELPTVTDLTSVEVVNEIDMSTLSKKERKEMEKKMKKEQKEKEKREKKERKEKEKQEKKEKKKLEKELKEKKKKGIPIEEEPEKKEEEEVVPEVNNELPPDESLNENIQEQPDESLNENMQEQPDVEKSENVEIELTPVAPVESVDLSTLSKKERKEMEKKLKKEQKEKEKQEKKEKKKMEKEMKKNKKKGFDLELSLPKVSKDDNTNEGASTVENDASRGNMEEEIVKESGEMEQPEEVPLENLSKKERKEREKKLKKEQKEREKQEKKEKKKLEKEMKKKKKKGILEEEGITGENIQSNENQETFVYENEGMEQELQSTENYNENNTDYNNTPIELQPVEPMVSYQAEGVIDGNRKREGSKKASKKKSKKTNYLEENLPSENVYYIGGPNNPFNANYNPHAMMQIVISKNEFANLPIIQQQGIMEVLSYENREMLMNAKDPDEKFTFYAYNQNMQQGGMMYTPTDRYLAEVTHDDEVESYLGPTEENKEDNEIMQNYNLIMKELLPEYQKDISEAFKKIMWNQNEGSQLESSILNAKEITEEKPENIGVWLIGFAFVLAFIMSLLKRRLI